MTSIRSELALFCAFRPPAVPCRRLHRPLVTVGVERCQTTAKNGARIVVDKRSLWQRKALKGSRLRLLIRGVLAAFLVVVVKERPHRPYIMILRQDRPTLASVSGIGFLIDGINAVATGSLWRSQPDGDIGSPPPPVPHAAAVHIDPKYPRLSNTPATKIRTNPYSRPRLPRDQRSTTESTEVHGKENPNQLPLSVSFPRATPARRVGSFRGYPFVMIFLAWVIFGES